MRQTTAADATLDTLYDHIDAMDPLAALDFTDAAATELAEMTASMVRRARVAGHSWQEIADALHVTRSAAWQRYHEATAGLPTEQS